MRMNPNTHRVWLAIANQILEKRTEPKSKWEDRKIDAYCYASIVVNALLLDQANMASATMQSTCNSLGISCDKRSVRNYLLEI